MAKIRLTREQRARQRKRRVRKMVGAVFLILAILGVYFLVSTGIEKVKIALDDTDEREYYANIYSSLVSLDPVEFDSIEKANQDMLLEAAIWTTLSNEDNTKYERNEYEAILLPSIEVDRYINKMYGSSFNYTHHSFEDYGLQFTYDEETSRYTIPITSTAGSYYPEVINIVKTGNTKVLTVAYMQLDSTGLTTSYSKGEETATVSKYMEYVLIKEGKEYFLYAIRTPQLDVTPEVKK